MPKIEKAIQKYEGIGLNYVLMSSREVTEEVANGNIDIGIVADPQKYPDLVIKPLRKEFTGLYSIDGSRKDKLFYNSQMIFINKMINEIQAGTKKKVDDYSTICSILKNINGMGLLPSIIASSDNKLKLIRKVGPAIDICLVYNANRIKSKAMSTVTSIVRDCSKSK